MEGMDITKIPLDYLTYPSKNVLIKKGSAFVRPGITNDGMLPTGQTKIIGEEVWRDALGGEKALRVTADGKLQLRYKTFWVTFFSGFDTTKQSVRFDTWLDTTIPGLNKKRLYAVDGTTNIYKWNGGVAVIDNVTIAPGIIQQINQPLGSDTQTNGGIDYAINDILTISTGDNNATVQVDLVVPGGIKTSIIHTTGSTYTPGDILECSNAHTGHNAILQIITVDGGGAVLTYRFLSVGTAYEDGDTLTCSGGTGTSFSINVTDIGNTISQFHILNPGTGYSISAQNATTGGSGTGATIDITQITGASIHIQGNIDFEHLGFDPTSGFGSSTTAITIVRFSGGTIAGTDTNSYTNQAGQYITLASNPVNIPTSGDLIISNATTDQTVLTTTIKDDIYNFENFLGVANFTSNRVYFSSQVTPLDYTIPAAIDINATSPFQVDLAENYTAMIKRYNAATQDSILWISDQNGWTKLRALDTANSSGFFQDRQQVFATDRIGALPFCLDEYEGDIIFFAQDRTLHRINSADVTSRDTLVLLSDDIEGLLQRINITNARLYYRKRYIYLTCQTEGIVIMLDMYPQVPKFMPPQYFPVGLMSVIDGVECGHSSIKDETFVLFTGDDDLEVPINATFAHSVYQSIKMVAHHRMADTFSLKNHSRAGITGRITDTTKVTILQKWEADGSLTSDEASFVGSEIKTFSISDLNTWASHINGYQVFGTAGDTSDTAALKRFYFFVDFQTSNWFEYQMIINCTGPLHLLGTYANEGDSTQQIPSALIYKRSTI